MIKLKEGQKVIDIDGNIYLIEKGDVVESYLKEAELSLKFSLNDFENYVYENEKKIIKNLKIYGIHEEEIPEISNYMTASSILGIDSRVLKNTDVQYWMEVLYSLL